MKWRHWAILIVLVLLNYIVFSAAFTRMAAQRQPQIVTRTPLPTFTVVAAGPIGWVVMPTNTAFTTRVPSTPTLVPVPSVDTLPPPTEGAATAAVTGTDTGPAPTAAAPTDAPPTATATATSAPTVAPTPTNTTTTQNVVHTVKSGEYLALIARNYGVSIDAIIRANNIQDPNLIMVGQKLVIPLSGEAPAPPPTSKPAQPTSPPAPAPTRKPATATPQPPTATPKPAQPGFQFTGSVVWDPQVAPNCAGPAVSRYSVVKDTAGNPVNGVRIAVNCYDNIFVSHATGTAGEYDAGHYDFAFGQSSPQPWTCITYVYEINGVPVTSSQVVSITFDTNDCQPHGSGHQVAIVNWVKNW